MQTMQKDRRRAIAFTLAGTIALYVSFAVLFVLEPRLLAPDAPPPYPALTAVIMAVVRGLSDFLFAAAISAAIFLLYWMLTSLRGFRSRRIATAAPRPAQLGRETLLAANFALAAGIQGIVFLVLAQLHVLQIYPAVSDHGWLAALSTLVLYLVLSDAWFYLCHRVYHFNRFVFRNIHAVHHLSVVTTPMTNSQISPWELLPSAAFAIVYFMIVPMAMPLVSLMVVAVSVYLILLHSGYEIFPRGTSEHWLGRWLVTPTYHQMHHELFTQNLGLYFNWWDRMFGTFSPRYCARFAAVTGVRVAPDGARHTG
jgi:lathosterol oxidase